MNDTADCFRYFANMAVEREKSDAHTAIDVGNPSFTCSVKREPVGVCGLVIPWNYPMLMLAWKIAPALAAGCTTVLKPSELTPITALEVAGIASRVGLPKGVLNVVTGFGPAAGAPLVTHPLVRKIAFTGSVATGIRVAVAAAKEIKRCSLELGGKSALIVHNDADIEAFADWGSVGIFFNAGQVCSATSRLLIHEEIKDKALARLAQVAKGIKMGSGLDPTNKLGPLVNETQYSKVVGFIRQGVAEGAKLLTGGVPAERDGYYVEPTIFVDCTPHMSIWKEEIFGPVLAVITYTNLDDAIRLANDTQYGLGGAVMSADKAVCNKVANELEAGLIWVNCNQATFVQAPWGGYKASGIGRELGPWGFDNFLETKQISTWVDPKTKGWGWFL